MSDSSHAGRKLFIIMIGAALLIAFGSGLRAGELEPPGGPGPTMKPLQELEPRRAIHAEMLPLTITDAGSSWYLAESIDTAGDGITVAADDVTIDLMGYRLEGGTGVGIRDDSALGVAGTTIKNGSVTGWASHGVALDVDSTIEKVIAAGNGGNGFQVFFGGRFQECRADSNGVHGFDLGGSSHVTDCVSRYNLQNGYLAGSGSVVIHSSGLGNYRNGIRVDLDCVVLEGSWQYNDQNRFYGGAGIWVRYDDNKIEGNHLVGNDIGIHIDGDENFIVRNSLATSNGPVYDIDTGASGNFVPNFSIGSSGAPEPWDNLCNDNSCP